jgi:hypothetical protein
MNDLGALAYIGNYTTAALLILVNCLKNQGALGARQYEDALRATIEAEGAPTQRLDYVMLGVLLRALEKQKPGESPDLDTLH